MSALVRLRRFPGLLLAIVGATLVVGTVTTAGALALDATASATLAGQAAADGVYRLPTAAIVADTPVVRDVIDLRTALLARELGPTFGDPVVTVRGDVVIASAPGGDTDVRIASRTGALDRVEVLERASVDGVWLADVTASELGVGAGDEIVVANAAARVSVPVAGVYRDLLAEPRTPFWASLDDFIWPRPGDETRPPALMLLELDPYVALDQALLDDQDAVTWEFVVPTASLSIEEAEDYRAELAAFAATLSDETTDVGSAFSSGLTEPLTGWLARTDEVIDQIGPPVQALMLAAVVLALGVLAGAGVFLVRRRRTEFGLLDARGVGLGQIAWRTGAEVLLPVVVGLAAGAALGLWLVGWVAPTGTVGDDAAGRAIRSLVVVGVVAVALVALVVARSVADLTAGERGGVRRAAARTPWEALALALAAIAFLGLRGDETAGPIDPLFLLFPILVLAGVVGLAVRGVRRGLPRLRQVGDGWSTARYLAVRRLTAGSRGALSLLTVAAVSVGVLVYAGTVAGSLRAAADEAASLRVGSDVAVAYAGEFEQGAGGTPVTEVGRIERASFQGDGADLDVLVVDPATFGSVAFWRDAYADASLEDLMASLGAAPDPRVAVVVAGGVDPGTDPILSLPGFDVPVRVAGTATTFPGIVGDRPLVVIDRAALETVVGSAGFGLEAFVGGTEVWGRGTEAEVREAVTAGGAAVLSSVSAAALRDTPEYLAVASMLRLLVAVGIVAGSVVFVVAALYLAARQRQAEVAYALSRRMGLARGTSRRSLVWEVLGMLGIAATLGAVVAVAASRLVSAEVQARVVEAEAVLFRLPVGLLAATGVALVAFALLAAAVVQRRADRADVAEVMRGAQ